MKRASVNFHQSSPSIEDKARDGVKLQNLLQDYLVLQKEFVSKKKKLQATKQKRDTLLAELRFLRQRRRYLLKIRSPEIELEDSKTTVIKKKMLEKASASEAAVRNHYPVPVSNSHSTEEEEKGGQEQEVRKELVIRKRKSSLIHGKAVGKKKISWQDPGALKHFCKVFAQKRSTGPKPPNDGPKVAKLLTGGLPAELVEFEEGTLVISLNLEEALIELTRRPVYLDMSWGNEVFLASLWPSA